MTAIAGGLGPFRGRKIAAAVASATMAQTAANFPSECDAALATGPAGAGAPECAEVRGSVPRAGVALCSSLPRAWLRRGIVSKSWRNSSAD